MVGEELLEVLGAEDVDPGQEQLESNGLFVSVGMRKASAKFIRGWRPSQ